MPDPKSTTEPAFVYCRVSTVGQSTVPEQAEWAGRCAAAAGLSILWDGTDGVPFLDQGRAGDDAGRPGLARLVEAFARAKREGRPVGRLILWDIDRLSRYDTLDAFALLAELRGHGLRYIHTHSRVIDLRNPLDRTLLGIQQDHKAHADSLLLSTRALDGMASVVKLGRWVGRVPLGYRLEREASHADADRREKKRRRSGRLVIDEEKAPVIRELFRRYAEGGSTTELAKWMDTQVPPRSVRHWSAQTVRQLLTNEVYVGTVVFGRRAKGKYAKMVAGNAELRGDDRAEENLSGSLVRHNAAPPLVDDATFRLCRERLAGGRRRGGPRNRLPLPLSRLGWCGDCGNPLHAVYATVSETKRKVTRVACSVRTRYGTSACRRGSTGTPHDQVLDAVLRVLSEQVLAGDFPERVTADVERQEAEARKRGDAERAALQKRVDELERAMAGRARRLATVSDDMLAAAEEGFRAVQCEMNEARRKLEASRLPQEDPAAPLDAAKVRQFFDACRQATSIKVDGPEAGALLNRLLHAVTEGFVMTWKQDRRGRATPDEVRVNVPWWLCSALTGSACTPCKAART